MYEHDLEIAERELIIGGGRASDLERVQRIAAIQTELIAINKRYQRSFGCHSTGDGLYYLC